MKNFICFSILAMLALGCDNKSTGETGTNPFECTVAPQDGVPVGQAMADIAHYRKYMDGLDTTYVKAFTMSSMDFIEGLGLPKGEYKKVQWDYVRLYIGLNDSMQFKLYITPVVGASLKKGSTEAGKDHILCKSILDAAGKEVSQEGYMLDFASPCPKTCPN